MKTETKFTMEIKFFCPRWGSENIPFAGFIQLAKKEGYNGVEISLPESKKKK